MSFELSKSLDYGRAFLTSKSSMFHRWDPFYHRPSIAELESMVGRCTSRTLRDYVNNIAGGATPSTSDSENNYTDEEDGIPFIRVQNLSVTGKLDLEDVKYITRDVHEGDLRRSQLDGGELLVKITGVGRMAVASVVPDNFEANINQHMVAIETGCRKVSEQLAAWLNLDIIERLASRRATGGTRPALDYDALKSIPALANERVRKRIENAVQEHQEKREKSRKLVAGTDELMLDGLGIDLPEEPPDTIGQRVFIQTFSQMAGGRFDPSAHHPWIEEVKSELAKSGLKTTRLRSIATFVNSKTDNLSKGDTYVGLEDVSSEGFYQDSTEKESISSAKIFQKGHILFSKLRPYLKKTYLAEFSGVCSTEFHVLQASQEIHAGFLFHWLRSKVIVGIGKRLMTGATHPRLQTRNIENFLVPVPPLNIQERIHSEIESQRSRAISMRRKASKQLEKAKAKVEELILNNEL